MKQNRYFIKWVDTFKLRIKLSDFSTYPALKILAVAKAMPAFFALAMPKIHLNLMVTQICPPTYL